MVHLRVYLKDNVVFPHTGVAGFHNGLIRKNRQWKIRSVLRVLFVSTSYNCRIFWGDIKDLISVPFYGYEYEKAIREKSRMCLNIGAHGGFDPATHCLEGSCSIQLTTSAWLFYRKDGGRSTKCRLDDNSVLFFSAELLKIRTKKPVQRAASAFLL